MDRHIILGTLRCLCLLQVSETLLVSIHFFLLLVHALLELHSVVLHHLGLPFMVSSLHLFLIHFQSLVSFLALDSLILNLVLKISDFERFLLTDVLGLVCFVFLHLFYLSLQVLDLCLDLIALSLLNQDNLTVLNLRQILIFLLTVFVLNREHTN